MQRRSSTHGGANDRLPATYVLLYSPRDIDERAVIEQILQAAVRYAAGDLAQRR